MTAHKDKTVPKEELVSFQPAHVSLVDEGAVGDPFIVVKSKEIPDAAKTNLGNEPIPFRVKKLFEHEIKNIHKRVTFLRKTVSDMPLANAEMAINDFPAPLTDEVKDIVRSILSLLDERVEVNKSVVSVNDRWVAISKSILSNSLKDSMEKMLSAMGDRLVNAAGILDQDDDSTLLDLAFELWNAAYQIRELGEASYIFYDFERSVMPDGDEINKTRWSEKYIESLPDSSFLVVVENDKEEDRKRLMPIADDNGVLSKSKLQRAIVDIDSLGVPDDSKNEILAKAKEILKNKKVVAKANMTTDNTNMTSSISPELKQDDIQDILKFVRSTMTQENDDSPSAESIKKEKKTMTTEDTSPKPEEISKEKIDEITKSISESVSTALQKSFADELAKINEHNAEVSKRLDAIDELEKRVSKVEASPVAPHSADPDGSGVAKGRANDPDGAEKDVFKGLFKFGPK